MNKPLIIALDFQSSSDALALVNQLGGTRPFVKVGMELYFKEGPTIIERLQERDCRIFLDLKCHDIPNTVKQAMKSLASLGVDLVNVHAAGGKVMMEAALEGLDIGTKAGRKRPQCIAVTQLTSTTEQMLSNELLIDRKMDSVVSHYANVANESGLDGVVCSALEVPFIKETCGNRFITVTPGIRNEEDANDDQYRVVTPSKAKRLGSDAIVVGRSITQAKDPFSTYLQMKNEWEALTV